MVRARGARTTQAGPIVRNPQTADVFQARIEEMMSAPSAAVQMRPSMFAEKVLGEAPEELRELAAATYRNKGF
jgi:hypothetical protein